MLDYLTLVIKDYKIKDGISSMINYLKIDESIMIRGNYGLGLNLNSLSEGQYVIICAGTGLFPFLDLFDFLFRKYKLKDIPGIHNNQLNRFKVQLIGSFQSKDFVGNDIV